MKRSFPAGLILIAVAGGLHAQYSVENLKAAGGGGLSSGGEFSVRGTVGQPFAGTAVNGPYRIEGGFWGGLPQVVHVAGLPQLSIVRTEEHTLALSWETGQKAIVVERSAALVPASWSVVPGVVQTEGETSQLVLTNTTGSRFFRLALP